MIEVRSTLDQSLTSPLLKLQMRKLKWFMLIFPLLFCFLGVMAIVFPEDGSDTSFGISLIVIAVLFIPFIRLLSKWSQRMINKSMAIMNAQTVNYFRFDEDKIYQETVKGEDYKGTAESSYSLLYKAYETDSHFFMFISTQQAHVIPKMDIVSGSVQELADIFRSRLGVKFKRIKMK